MPHLLASLPSDVSERVYIEPFLGAGSLFFALQPAKAILGDANASLASTYCQIRDGSGEVLARLKELVALHSSEMYYEIRAEYNRSLPSPAQAARFIYLNKACFNGVFRVNGKGEFNVPKGSKDNLSLPNQAYLKAIAKALATADIAALDYSLTMRRARSKSFTYLDPPYPALNETAYFAHYTRDRFDEAAQRNLALQTSRLHKRGALFLMSNADVPLIRELYGAFDIKPLPVRRFVSCKKTRLQVSEVLIRNY